VHVRVVLADDEDAVLFRVGDRDALGDRQRHGRDVDRWRKCEAELVGQRLSDPFGDGDLARDEHLRERLSLLADCQQRFVESVGRNDAAANEDLGEVVLHVHSMR